MNVSASSPTAPSFLRLRLILLVAFLCVPCAAALAQAASSDYTTSLPSVDKVKAQLRGTDPIDTTARQVAVFEYLQVYIRRIKETRDYRGPYSPGESKLLTDYAKAQYDLTQSFTKTHTPQEVSAFNLKEGQYSINNALGWIKQLEGSQAADAYKGAEAELNASQQRNNARIQKDLSPTQSGGSLMDGFRAGAGGGGSLDPDQRRCLELGGSYNACAGAMMGLVKGLSSLLSLGASDNTANQPPPLSGVILVGSYHSRTDLPEIGLTANGVASLSNCGTLVDVSHTYTLRKSGATTQAVLDNEPDPIALTLRSDGSLAGPGNISVKGSIITGYHNQTSCTAPTPYTASNCSTTSTPLYSPSMQRCTLSVLAPQPAPPPPPKPTGLVGAVGDMFGAGDPVATIYGFRVIGPYASSSGMLLSFDNHYVTLDCGKAHVNAPYTVDNTATGFVIHIQNAGGAFLLALAPDNTLRGSGSTTVNGKLVSAVSGENVSFTPHSESCTVGTFAPKGKRNTMLASNGLMPAIPAEDSSPAYVAAAPAPALAPVAAPPAGISARAAGMTLAISSSFPIANNPLAGRVVQLMSERYDIALRKVGAPISADVTPGRALIAYMANCGPPKSCPAYASAMHPYFVGKATFDGNGKATVSADVPPGSYYVFSAASGTSGALIWDLPITLKAGDNTITLTATNAELVH